MPARHARVLGRAAALAAVSTLTAALGAAPCEAQEEDRWVVVHAARVITVSGEEYSPGSVVLHNGRVEVVGQRVEVPPQAEVIDARDRVLMPGLICASTRLGLRSYPRSGNTSHLSVAGELVNLEPRELSHLLEAGYVAAGFVPEGGPLAGQAVVIRPLEGGADLEVPFLRWRLTDLPNDKRVLRDSLAQARQVIEREDAARKAWEEEQAKKAQEAEAAAQRAAQEAEAAGTGEGDQPQPEAEAGPAEPETFTPPPIPPELQPLVALLREAADALPVHLELSSASGYVHWIEGFEDLEVEPVLHLANGRQTDLHLLLDRLGDQAPGEGSRVVLQPRTSYEDYTRTRRNLPAELAAAGVEISLLPPADSPAGFGALFEALALLHRDGLSRSEALAAVTLHPARALGLEQDLGSIEEGRRGDLILLDGDPLEPGTRVVGVLLDGRLAWEHEER
jgi:Amidohydrolase family